MADETRHPSTVESLAAIVAQAGTTHEIFRLILKVLDEHEKQLYACREDLKMARASAASADRRCAEALYKLGEIRQDSRKNRAN